MRVHRIFMILICCYVTTQYGAQFDPTGHAKLCKKLHEVECENRWCFTKSQFPYVPADWDLEWQKKLGELRQQHETDPVVHSINQGTKLIDVDKTFNNFTHAIQAERTRFIVTKKEEFLAERVTRFKAAGKLEEISDRQWLLYQKLFDIRMDQIGYGASFDCRTIIYEALALRLEMLRTAIQQSGKEPHECKKCAASLPSAHPQGPASSSSAPSGPAIDSDPFAPLIAEREQQQPQQQSQEKR